MTQRRTPRLLLGDRDSLLKLSKAEQTEAERLADALMAVMRKVNTQKGFSERLPRRSALIESAKHYVIGERRKNRN